MKILWAFLFVTNQGGSISGESLNLEYTIPFCGDSNNNALWTYPWPLCMSLSLLPGYPPQGNVGMTKPSADHSLIATVPYLSSSI